MKTTTNRLKIDRAELVNHRIPVDRQKALEDVAQAMGEWAEEDCRIIEDAAWQKVTEGVTALLKRVREARAVQAEVIGSDETIRRRMVESLKLARQFEATI